MSSPHRIDRHSPLTSRHAPAAVGVWLSRVRRLCWLGCVCLLIAGCGSAEDAYFPLDKGRAWQYALSVTILDETARQKQFYRNIGAGRIDGRRVAVRELPGSVVGYYRVEADGIVRVATRRPGSPEVIADPPGQYVLRLPPETGAHWSAESRLSLIESRTFEPRDRIIPRRYPVRLEYRVADTAATVDVPAGRFERCVEVRSEGRATVIVDRGTARAEVRVEGEDWYAPGVGLVKSTRREWSESTFLKEGGFSMELEWHR